MKLNTIPGYTVPPGTRLGLKVVYADGRPESDKAPPDFRWPLAVGAIVTAPDWNPPPACGGGLHLWEDGTGTLAASGITDIDGTAWLAVEYDDTSAVRLDGKVKVPSCKVVAVGDRGDVASWLASMLPGRPVHYATVAAGDYGTATAGHRGTATAGHRGTATAGHRGTASADHRGTAMAGYLGTATAGEWGTASAGYLGTATAGDGGTATAGFRGTASAGEWGIATAGDGGTATAGHRGIATAGDGGTATAGEGGALVILWWDSGRGVYRRRCAEVDGTVIKPGVAYKLDSNGNFVEVK